METLDIRDHVPKEYRAGFRGFAEFDKRLERELKQTERPQHESFDGRNTLVKQVREAIQAKVKQFAEERSWISSTETLDASNQEKQFATEFLQAFAAGAKATKRRSKTGSNKLDNQEDLDWGCKLDLEYPSAKSSRVNWGQEMRNIHVKVECEPRDATRQIGVLLGKV